ncbi:MAG: hypothetical protein HQK66_15355, partial [Desulfamplus sp.]|nr:hypothetical protein [Desulfamplus sp.]
ADRDDAFQDSGIESISNLLSRTSRALNQWEKETEKKDKGKGKEEKNNDKDKEGLLNQLPGNFFRLLENLTISRSRKHITTYYGTEEVGRFPGKLKPDTYTPYIDTGGELLKFKETHMKLEELILAVYMPMSYIKKAYRKHYRERFQTKYNNKIIFSHEDREFITSKLHRFNLFKRLDSSVFAFGETLRRLKERIASCIEILEEYQEEQGQEQKREKKRAANTADSAVASNTTTGGEFPFCDDSDFEGEFMDEDAPALDYKYTIKIRHLDINAYLHDLYFDRMVLDVIYSEVSTVLEEKRDNKLATLQTVVLEKVKKTPYNAGNRKVLIFTAFADTARYLYKALSPAPAEPESTFPIPPKKPFKSRALPTAGPSSDSRLPRNQPVIAMISGTGKPMVSVDSVERTFDAVLSAFSPKSRIKVPLPPEKQVDILIGTDCISEGQNLQDCDCVINYDIQWNPVTLIQRFGRIDRIGSSNTHIKMINFFPDMDLNEYLSLEKRVKSKMISANISSTGDEDVLSPEMNDISFRNRQLERLREEVIDLDEAGENISLTDLNMNEYLFELADYLKRVPEIREIPRGIYAVTHAMEDGEKAPHQGVIFCFKHRGETTKPDNDSTLYPYYLIFMDRAGNVTYGNNRARELLKLYRKLCYGTREPVKPLVDKFLEETRHVKDMSFYSGLLSSAIQSIRGQEETEAEQSIFDFSGYNNPFAGETADDFELVSFLVVG